MKLPKQQLNQILDGMAEMLGPAEFDSTAVEEITGAELIKRGVRSFKNASGITEIVNPLGKYVQSRPVKVSVNHRRKMKQLIEEARDEDDMQTKLGAYLVKYARSMPEVCASIPPIFKNYKTESDAN